MTDTFDESPVIGYEGGAQKVALAAILRAEQLQARIDELEARNAKLEAVAEADHELDAASRQKYLEFTGGPRDTKTLESQEQAVERYQRAIDVRRAALDALDEPDFEQVREWWHVYRGPLMGAQATMISRSSPTPPEEMPDQLPDTELMYLGSFDHGPTEQEIARRLLTALEGI